MRTNHSKNFYPHTTKTQAVRPNLFYKARFSTCSHTRLLAARYREREREVSGGAWAAQVHGALIFSIHFLIFLPFSFLLCVVTCQQRALLFAQCHFVIVCIVFCIFCFFFYSRNCHFQCLDSSRLGFLFFALFQLSSPFPLLDNHKGLAKSIPKRKYPRE